MDPFAARMIARGPTLADDRDTWTGSLHIVDLPDADAAREFVEREPYNRAGLFESHLIRRFANLLGRSMWDFPGDPVDPRFLLIAHLSTEEPDRSAPTPRSGLTTLPPDRLIVHGELSTLDTEAPAGAAVAIEAPASTAADALPRLGLAGLDERFDLEIHNWECGGRR
jgi:uncharacterized protein